MNITLFNKPERHPYGMLDVYNHAHEKESKLAWHLVRCVEAGEWLPIESQEWIYDAMAEDGLLIDHGEWYSLTAKAKGLLYGYYAKELDDDPTG
jgi:hypothetical protein